MDHVRDWRTSISGDEQEQQQQKHQKKDKREQEYQNESVNTDEHEHRQQAGVGGKTVVRDGPDLKKKHWLTTASNKMTMTESRQPKKHYKHASSAKGSVSPRGTMTKLRTGRSGGEVFVIRRKSGKHNTKQESNSQSKKNDNTGETLWSKVTANFQGKSPPPPAKIMSSSISKDGNKTTNKSLQISTTNQGNIENCLIGDDDEEEEEENQSGNRGFGGVINFLSSMLLPPSLQRQDRVNARSQQQPGAFHFDGDQNTLRQTQAPGPLTTLKENYQIPLYQQQEEEKEEIIEAIWHQANHNSSYINKKHLKRPLYKRRIKLWCFPCWTCSIGTFSLIVIFGLLLVGMIAWLASIPYLSNNNSTSDQNSSLASTGGGKYRFIDSNGDTVLLVRANRLFDLVLYPDWSDPSRDGLCAQVSRLSSDSNNENKTSIKITFVQENDKNIDSGILIDIPNGNSTTALSTVTLEQVQEEFQNINAMIVRNVYKPKAQDEEQQEEDELGITNSKFSFFYSAGMAVQEDDSKGQEIKWDTTLIDFCQSPRYFATLSMTFLSLINNDQNTEMIPSESLEPEPLELLEERSEEEDEENQDDNNGDITRYILSVLFFALRGQDRLEDFKNWLTNDHPCLWQGISCGYDSGGDENHEYNIVRLGPVTGIRIEMSGIHKVGTIPKEIYHLTSLKDFLLHGKVSGSLSSPSSSLPFRLSRLLNLQSLDLDFTDIEGTLPAFDLGLLTRLTKLVVHSTSISGDLPTELGQLTELTKLSLRSRRFTGDIPSEWGRLSQLQNLTVEMGSSGRVDSSILALPQLRNIILQSSTALSGEISNTMFQGNVNWEHIDIREVFFEGSIPTTIGRQTRLQTLQLDDNKLQGTIPSEIGLCTNLRELGLANNNLRGSIPTELGNLSNAQTIDLKYNKLSQLVPLELGNLTSSETIFLNGNDDLWGSIPEILCQPPRRTTVTIPCTLRKQRLLSCKVRCCVCDVY